MGEHKTACVKGHLEDDLMAFSQILSYLVVALGGGIGAVLRFWVGQNVPFPYGTFTVNVIGSFFIGIFFAISLQPLDDKGSLFFMTGLLGGFTTLSAFSLDVLKLYEDDKIFFAFLYVFSTLTFSLLAVFTATEIARHQWK